MMKPFAIAVVVTLCTGPAFAQLGQLGKIAKGVEQAQKIQDLKITDEEEQALGAQVSDHIRQRYGVVQDEAVHKYVSLVGTVIAQASSRPGLPWKFIVLDTDAVNAFAAPGGYVHITRGALGLIENEAQLAGVLGHEITHVSEKHTLKAIQKGKMVELGASETLGSNKFLFEQLANKTYELIIENSFDRDDEREADKVGITLANKVGYAPSGLSVFLQGLADRNTASTEKRGLFASHPDIKDRIDRITKLIASGKLAATAIVEARYRKYISYEAKAQTEIATIEPGAAGLTGGGSAASTTKTEEPKKEEEKKKGFGLGKLMRPGGAEKQTAQVTASGGARGVDPERDAKGGSNARIVAVALTPAEIADFRKGITG